MSAVCVSRGVYATALVSVFMVHQRSKKKTTEDKLIFAEKKQLTHAKTRTSLCPVPRNWTISQHTELKRQTASGSLGLRHFAACCPPLSRFVRAVWQV